MKLMVVWDSSPETRDTSLARFKETGGAPPAGVKMLGRWHDVGGGGGFVLAETDDLVAVSRWVLGWSDVLSFQVVPVIDDEEFIRSLS